MGSHAKRQASLESAAQITSRVIHNGQVVSIRCDEIDYPGGLHKTWDIVVHPGAVAIIPINENGDLILVEQWRRAIGKITLEIPAGIINPNEKPEETAQRELQEEIGKKAGKLIFLGSYYSSPGVCTEVVHLYVGKDLTASQLRGDDTDEIDIRIVSFEDAYKFIENHTICDAKTALAIMRFGRSL